MLRFLVTFLCLSLLCGCGRTAKLSTPPASTSADSARAQQPLPESKTVLDWAKRQAWGKELQDIPATVIDKGVLKHVPYASYRTGDYELNIYGDPNRPCCVEIGLYPPVLTDMRARTACRDFIQELLFDKSDYATLRSLSLTKDLKTSRGITFEVTPETDEDAYGAWWISIYDEAEVAKSRSSPAELAEISQPIATIVATKAPASSPPRPANEPVASPKPSSEPSEPVTAASSTWTADDLKNVRRLSGSSTPAASGSVYVHGYTKKDGTYVAPHTRSAPTRR